MKNGTINLVNSNSGSVVPHQALQDQAFGQQPRLFHHNSSNFRITARSCGRLSGKTSFTRPKKQWGSDSDVSAIHIVVCCCKLIKVYVTFDTVGK